MTDKELLELAAKVQGKVSRIDGLTLVTVHGVRFVWNDTLQSYWSIDGNPRELQRIDLASANGQLLKVQAGHVTHLRSAMWPAPFFVLSIMEWDGEVMLYHAASLEVAQSYAAVVPGKHTILNADFTEFEPMEPEPTERESAQIKQAFRQFWAVSGFDATLPSDMKSLSEKYPLEFAEACYEEEVESQNNMQPRECKVFVLPTQEDILKALYF